MSASTHVPTFVLKICLYLPWSALMKATSVSAVQVQRLEHTDVAGSSCRLIGLSPGLEIAARFRLGVVILNEGGTGTYRVGLAVHSTFFHARRKVSVVGHAPAIRILPLWHTAHCGGSNLDWLRDDQRSLGSCGSSSCKACQRLIMQVPQWRICIAHDMHTRCNLFT